MKELRPAEPVFFMMSRTASKEVGKMPGASVGYALPQDINKHGYISEYHSYGETARDVGEHAVKLAKSMHGSRTGEAPLRTFSIPDSSAVGENGDWMNVISAAVFVI